MRAVAAVARDATMLRLVIQIWTAVGARVIAIKNGSYSQLSRFLCQNSRRIRNSGAQTRKRTLPREIATSIHVPLATSP